MELTDAGSESQKKNICLFTDLDNTLIYSHRHEIGPEKRCVELYEGRAVSFMTEQTVRALERLRRKMLVVPVTTRTVEQYGRIDLGAGAFPFALVCNGGILLRDGKEDAAWYEASKREVQEAVPAMEQAVRWLERVPKRLMEVRFLRELFVFTKCAACGQTAEALRAFLDTETVDVLCNGVKLYVVPRRLEKGAAIRRFRKYLAEAPAFSIAAGDSLFDVSMLDAADLGIAPRSLLGARGLSGKTVVMEGEGLFSEQLLAYLEQVFLRGNAGWANVSPECI